MEVLTVLKTRLAELEIEAEELDRQVRILSSRLEHVRRLARLYGSTVEQEQLPSKHLEETGDTSYTRAGIDTDTEQPEGKFAKEVGADHALSVAPPTESAIDILRRHIKENLAAGFAPGDILRLVFQLGLSTNRAFAYNAIKRLKDNGEIVGDAGRYYPTGRLQM